ncbi:unnamed protein product [Prorocentrum cordatum]|uniref:RGS domain-containing protein n=1 Tax=Prorocentrum cordatum TaxID=2364126 RepID=A0ABN9UU50_9DINO|nr:unnamed protein product [Polarella glacialis]
MSLTSLSSLSKCPYAHPSCSRLRCMLPAMPSNDLQSDVDLSGSSVGSLCQPSPWTTTTSSSPSDVSSEAGHVAPWVVNNVSTARSDTRIAAQRKLPGKLVVFTVRGVVLGLAVLPLSAPIAVMGYGWHGYADFSGLQDLDGANTCSATVGGSYLLRGNPHWVALGNTYKFRMATVAISAFSVAVIACFAVRGVRNRTPLITHVQCWLLLNWLQGVALCFERGCKWCVDSDDASIERYCSPLWQGRSMLTASVYAYLTFLIRMRHMAVQSAFPEKRHVKDTILDIFRLQVLIVLVCLCVSVAREAWSPGSQDLATMTVVCVMVNFVLTAVSMFFSLHLFIGHLRVAEDIVKVSSGRRRMEAKCVVSSVQRQVIAHALAFAFDIAAVIPASLAALEWSWFPGRETPTFVMFQELFLGADLIANSCLVLSYWGLVPRPAIRGRRASRQTHLNQEPRLPQRSDSEWDRKVGELANRGITLRALLHFYMDLGVRNMPHFDPDAHSTEDVARQAIIPLTAADPTFGPCALATKLMEGRPTLAQRMVTHTWRNKFADLIAAIVADALDQTTYEAILPRLKPHLIGCLVEELETGGRLEITYWVCVASVNQHASICAHVPRVPQESTGGVLIPGHPVCTCSHPKWLNDSSPRNCDGESILCEMNKFDAMMILLAEGNHDFRQVIACDCEFQVFTRSWCIAEIYMAHEHCMKASLIVHSARMMARHRDVVEQLDVRNMSASRPEDKAAIMRNIADPIAFNETVKWILFDEDKGLFKGQGTLHTAALLGRISSTRYRAAETTVGEELGDSADTKRPVFLAV